MLKTRTEKLWNWPTSGRKLLLGMLHLGGDSPDEIDSRALYECEAFLEGGMDGVVVENYFGSIEDVRRLLPVVKREFPELLVGVDVIWQNDLSFDLAVENELPFLQLDSMAGHLLPDDEAAFDARINWFRANTDALILGGVRLKNQPYLSGNDLATDLEIATRRGDGVIVTGVATGVETETEKIVEFRENLGSFPLVVGAGLNHDNCVEQMTIADGAIVGSSLKTDGVAQGVVELARVRDLVALARSTERELVSKGEA